MQKLACLLSAVLLVLSLAGCTPSQEPEDVPQPPKVPKQEKTGGDSTRKVVTDYATGLTGSIDKSRKTQQKAEMDSLNSAVQSYYFEHGEYPPDLDSIKGYAMGVTDLSAYNYDPDTGKITQK